MGDPRLLLPSREGKGKAEASAGLKCVHTVGVNTCTSNKATRHVQSKGKRGKSRVWPPVQGPGIDINLVLIQLA